MSKQSDSVKRWRQHSKQRIVDSMGGKCQSCGYDKCNEALELHHIEPSGKELSFGRLRANPKSWNTIVAELRKCILLCSNCHKEVHYGIISLPTEYNSFNENFSDYKKLLTEKEKTYCEVCGKEKASQNLRTCSQTCSATLSGKINWDEINLTDLKINKNMSNVAIAELLGISEAVVRKRLKKDI